MESLWVLRDGRRVLVSGFFRGLFCKAALGRNWRNGRCACVTPHASAEEPAVQVVIAIEKEHVELDDAEPRLGQWRLDLNPAIYISSNAYLPLLTAALTL